MSMHTKKRLIIIFLSLCLILKPSLSHADQKETSTNAGSLSVILPISVSAVFITFVTLASIFSAQKNQKKDSANDVDFPQNRPSFNSENPKKFEIKKPEVGETCEGCLVSLTVK